jgi:hypothetical protein
MISLFPEANKPEILESDFGPEKTQKRTKDLFGLARFLPFVSEFEQEVTSRQEEFVPNWGKREFEPFGEVEWAPRLCEEPMLAFQDLSLE